MREIVARGELHTYGAEAGDLIREAVVCYERFLALSPGTLRAALTELRRPIERSAAWLLEELEDVRGGAGVSLDDVLMLNARSELLSIWAGRLVGECTSVGVTSVRSRDGVTRVAQNWDWITEMQDLPVILQSAPRTGPAYATFCEAGQLAKVSVNARGLGVGLNFLGVPPSEAARAREGLPVHLLLRAILRAGTVAEAIDALHDLPRGGCAHFLLGDAKGEVASVEVRPSRVDVIPPRDGIVTHANDFEAGLLPGAPRPCRSARLAARLEGVRPDRDNLLEALRDHEPSAAEQICSHPLSAFAASSIASIVIECAPEPMLWVSEGLPCERHEAVAHAVTT